MIEIETDVLIIGGGIAGLWLLKDLIARGFHVILLEKNKLGGGQTCHSHVYLHQGHLYREAGLAVGVKSVSGAWDGMMRCGNLQSIERASYFGFTNPADAKQRTDLWGRDDLRLFSRQLQPSEFPQALAGGSIRLVYQSPECCVDGEALMRCLGERLTEHIGSVDGISGFEADTTRIQAVLVALRGGDIVRAVPRAVVLCAGVENQALLLLASGGNRDQLTKVQGQQQLRKAHMLVVRGEERFLPPLTGVFPSLGGLFLVSRRLDGENVWLVSDDRSPPLGFPEDWMRFDVRWWFRRVWSSLCRLSPQYLGQPERLQWGVYAAPKAEGRATGSIPQEEAILRFDWNNLWAVWPTKLTLAPRVSGTLIDAMSQSGVLGVPAPTRSADVWNSVRHFPGWAPERWKKTKLLDWMCFQRMHDLELE